jgi:hypothetical protein
MHKKFHLQVLFILKKCISDLTQKIYILNYGIFSVVVGRTPLISFYEQHKFSLRGERDNQPGRKII